MLPAWQVCCVVCCTEVEGWGVETVTGGRAGRENLKTRLNRFNVSESIQRPGYES